MKISLQESISLLQRKRQGLLTNSEIAEANKSMKEIESMPHKDNLSDTFREIYFNLLLVCSSMSESFASGMVCTVFDGHGDIVTIPD
jgi:hypothetical protein